MGDAEDEADTETEVGYVGCEGVDVQVEGGVGECGGGGALRKWNVCMFNGFCRLPG